MVRNPKGKINYTHEQKAHDLYFSSSNAIYEIDSEVIPRNGGADCDDGLEAGDFESFFIDVDVFEFKELAVNLGLKEVAAVEDHVEEKPIERTREEVSAVEAKEFSGEKGIGWSIL